MEHPTYIWFTETFEEWKSRCREKGILVAFTSHEDYPQISDDDLFVILQNRFFFDNVSAIDDSDSNCENIMTNGGSRNSCEVFLFYLYGFLIHFNDNINTNKLLYITKVMEYMCYFDVITHIYSAEMLNWRINLIDKINNDFVSHENDLEIKYALFDLIKFFADPDGNTFVYGHSADDEISVEDLRNDAKENFESNISTIFMIKINQLIQ